MSQRVVALLEPVVGPDRVRVNVAIRLDPQSREETEERWDPNTVVRSRQLTADQTNGAALGGVAGARGNVPPPPADPTVPGQPATAQAQTVTGPGSSRSAETTNYEVSRTTRHVIQPPGDVSRLSVAVILDDDQVPKQNEDGSVSVTRKPRSREELQKIQALVAAAVGLDPDRGDKLTVENVAFDEPVEEEGPPPGILDRIKPEVMDFSRIAAVAAIAIVALLFIVRPLLRKAGVQPAAGAPALAAGGDPALAAMPAPGSAPKTVADLEHEIDAELNALTAQYAENRRLPVLTRRVSSVTVNEPENVAKLLRAWIQDEGR
jgi:flagellar M-ring protein FliF